MNDAVSSFWDHTAAFRRSILLGCGIISIGIFLAFLFYQDLFSFLIAPIKSENFRELQTHKLVFERISNPHSQPKPYYLPRHGEVISISPGTVELGERQFEISPNGYIDLRMLSAPNELVFLGPLDGITTCIKICFWVGLLGTSPLWILVLIQFIVPALYSHERKMIFPFLGLSLFFLMTGLLFAYYVTIPAANYYLLDFNQGLGTNLWSVSNYLDFSISLFLANAFAFESCVVLLLFVHYGVVSAETLINKRRHFIVIAFIVGALLTPPDVLTQVMLAVPLIGLYEGAILYARIKKLNDHSQNS